MTDKNAIAVPVKAVEPLICGSPTGGGLTRSEINKFDTDLDVLRKHPTANKRSLWSIDHSKATTYDFCVPWTMYPLASVGFVPFNGCSSTVVQNFATLHYAIDLINRKSGYNITGVTQLTVDIGKFREYVVFCLLSLRIQGTPLFINLPPAGEFYGSARKFLEKHGAEIACQFVNPNYPDRHNTKEYTTLYVFNYMKWIHSMFNRFTGLIK